MGERRTLLRILGVCALLTLAAIPVAVSMPILMDRYNEHPASLKQYRDKCVICHVVADGSGPLTGFGDRYDRVGLEFTDALIAKNGNLFIIDGVEPAVAASGEKVEHAGVMVPGNEPWDVRKYYLAECKKCHGKYGDGDPFQGVPAFATQKWLAERAHETEDLMRILMFGKDDMVGQAGKITDGQASELLDLVMLIAKKYS